VWTEDSTVDLYLSRENSQGELVTDGSTLVHGKVPVDPRSGRIDYENPVRVKSVDFSRWILNSFRRQDHLCMKMDIEGAEYAVLAKMIADKSVSYVNNTFVEFHYREDRPLCGITRELHDSIRAQVGKATRLGHWH
jgi:FkbM family methyltransferase